MRVYVPSTLPGLAAAMAAGEFGPAPLEGYAVTPALREWYADGDQEELEYAAMAEAARASLRLLGRDPDAPRRRAVVAAEVEEAAADDVHGDLVDGRGRVRVAQPVPFSRVASVHVDGVDATGDIAAAVAALPAADAGDEDASFTVDGAEGHELLWYATQEIPELVAEFGTAP